MFRNVFKIQQQTRLENGTDTFERFENTPQPLLFKVFIFNVTNPNEVLEGECEKKMIWLIQRGVLDSGRYFLSKLYHILVWTFHCVIRI